MKFPMTSPFRFHPLIAVAALAISSGLFTASATDVLAGAPSYRLVTTNSVSGTSKVVIRDTLWTCSGGICVTNAVTSRPEIVCSAAAKKIGKLSAFTANGTAFSDEQLVKCNAKAK
jgi:hypothetical protein